jgi:hypothetical protein
MNLHSDPARRSAKRRGFAFQAPSLRATRRIREHLRRAGETAPLSISGKRPGAV